MKAGEYNTILQHLVRIENQVISLRELIKAQMENTVDAGFYQEQVKKLNAEKRETEYQQLFQSKYTIDQNGKLIKKDA